MAKEEKQKKNYWRMPLIMKMKLKKMQINNYATKICVILVGIICVLPISQGNCAQVSAGWKSSLYLDDAGIVWEWGKRALSPIPRLANVKAALSGSFSTLALKNNGEVWAWGTNSWGNLLEKKITYGNYWGPQKILDGAKDIILGDDRWFAIKTDGSLWGWGMLNYGMGLKFKGDVGADPPPSYKMPPKQILPPTVVQASSDLWTTLALVKNSTSGADAVTLMGWGRNDCGNIGNYEEKESMTPKDIIIEGFEGAQLRKVFIAGNNGMALTAEGEVLKWGTYGNCRDGTWPEEFVPRKLEGVRDIVDISGSMWATVMLQSDGTLWGTGFVVMDKTRWLPTKPAVANKIMEDVQSFAIGEKHLLVIKKDGTLWGLGSNADGQLGRPAGGAPNEWYSEPVQIVMPPLEEADTSKFVQ